MKKIIPLIICLMLLCSCHSNYDIDGTYASEGGNNNFTLVINNGFCMIDVLSKNESGGTASAVFNGKVSKDSDMIVITIDKEKGVAGNKFEFFYNDNQETLTNTSDKQVLKKTKVENVNPDGEYTAESGNKSFDLLIDGKNCSLDVISKNESGQSATVSSTGSVSIDGNVVTLHIDNKNIKNDNYKFIYSTNSGSIMNTADGTIFEKKE